MYVIMYLLPSIESLFATLLATYFAYQSRTKLSNHQTTFYYYSETTQGNTKCNLEGHTTTSQFDLNLDFDLATPKLLLFFKTLTD